MKIKKVLKIVLAIIVIALLVIICLKAYSVKILFDISDAIAELREGDFAYRITENYTMDNSEEKHQEITEYIKNQNVYIMNKNFDENTSVEWFDLANTNELYNYFYYDLDEDPYNGKIISYDLQTQENIEYNLKCPFTGIYFADIRNYLEYDYTFTQKINTILGLPYVKTRRI